MSRSLGIAAAALIAATISLGTGCGAETTSDASSTGEDRGSAASTTTSSLPIADPIEPGPLDGDPGSMVAFEDPATEIASTEDLTAYLLPGLSGAGADCMRNTIDLDDVLDAPLDAGAKVVVRTVDACVESDSIGSIVAMYAALLEGDIAGRYADLRSCTADAFAVMDEVERRTALEAIYQARLDLSAAPTSPGVAGDAIERLTSCGRDVTDATTTAVPSGGETRAIPWTSASPGDCVPQWPAAETFSSIDVIGCDQPHVAEAIANSQLRASDVALRGEDEAASGTCSAAFKTYSGRDLAGSGFEVTWLVAAPNTSPGAVPRAGDLAHQSRVICFAELPESATSTGSLAG